MEDKYLNLLMTSKKEEYIESLGFMFHHPPPSLNSILWFSKMTCLYALWRMMEDNYVNLLMMS